jgi:hypothetical protein
MTTIGPNAAAPSVPCGVTLHLAERGPYLWEEADRRYAAAALARIAEAGVELVRLPLVWESFQPTPSRVAASSLGRLVELLDEADSVGLRVLPWLFVGPWMGLRLLPPWAVGPPGPGGRTVYTRGRRRELPGLDLWTEPAQLEAQGRLIDELGSALDGHPALWGWEVAAAPERAFGHAPLVVRADWLRRHAERIAGRPDAAPAGVSLDADEVATLGPAIASSVAWLGILPSLQTPPWAEEGLLDPYVLPYLACLLRWLSGRPALLHVLGRPGAPPEAELPPGVSREALHTEAELGRAAERLLGLVPLAETAAVVARVWADPAPRLMRLPPFDREPLQALRGLVRADGARKPELEAFAAWAAGSHSARLHLREGLAAGPASEPPEAPADALAGLGLPTPPAHRSSPLLLLPGGEDYERLSRELGLAEGRPAGPPRARGTAPAWADLEPGEVEADPAEHVPRLYRRFRAAALA